MIKKSFNAFVHKRFDRWLKRRIPASATQRLTNRNIFILPSGFGFAYLVFVFVLFLLGTNYQNNVVILLSYLFASVFISAMLQSFFNLSGLKLHCHQQVSTYAKQQTHFSLTIDTDKPRYSLVFQFPHQGKHLQKKVNTGTAVVNIPYCSEKRGVHIPGRLRISSEYSLGLFTCWTQLDFGCEVITYPQQKKFQNLHSSICAHQDDEHGINVVEGGDDFGDLRQYRQGESLSQIAWKQQARGQGWLSKTNQQQQGNDVWLTLDNLPSTDLEVKLQMLCYLMLEQYQQGQSWAMDLGSEKVPPNTGKKHLTHCLTMLAHYSSKKMRTQAQNEE